MPARSSVSCPACHAPIAAAFATALASAAALATVVLAVTPPAPIRAGPAARSAAAPVPVPAALMPAAPATALPEPARADLALARRLERAEARANAAFVEARAAVAPAIGAAWLDVGGAYAMFDGVGSPLTQSFGLGLFSPASADGLATIERFLAERGAGALHEVSPMADPALLTLLPERGYRPVELTSVLHRPLAPELVGEARGATAVRARPIDAGEEGGWAELVSEGWGTAAEVGGFIRGFAEVTARSRGVTCFVAELDGTAIGAGAVWVHDRVAVLAGASTLPAWRGRGAQGALLGARLAFAAGAGCDLAMMGAAPGSTSQTNAERQGFRIAYTRIKWGRERA